MWRWAILETDCLETLRESSVKSVALVFVCLRVCAPTYILPVCLSLRYDLLSCYHSCVHCRKLIHMLPAATPLCPSTHSKSNPPSAHHFISFVIQTWLHLYPLLFFASSLTLSQHAPGWKTASCDLLLSSIHSCPALTFTASTLPSDRPPRAAPRPSPLWRVATIETGEPKWQPPAPVWPVPGGQSHIGPANLNARLPQQIGQFT